MVSENEAKQTAAPQPVEKITVQDSSVAKPPRRLVLSPGYYVVVGSYRNFENALNLQIGLQDKGYPEVYAGLYGKKGIYYVYIFATYSVSEAKEKAKNYAAMEDFRDAWILKVED